MKKFGTFKGVFVPSTEAILGTVLFLLLPTLTGDVGLVFISAIIILAHSVTLSTAFSLADCATNLNNIGGGGMYALAKRSLGKAFGGSIGIQLYVAQAASIGFYSIGFAEPLQPIISPLLQHIPFFQVNTPHDLLFQKQIFSSIIFVVFFLIVMFGADFTLKVQMLILFVLLSSVAVIFISPITGIKYQSVGLFNSLSNVNLFGNRAVGLSLFFITFTQFFPAVTGIDAGVGMSGDLENPKKSLVKGTFSAILITFVVYLASAFVFSLIKKEFLITGYTQDNPEGNLLTVLLGINNVLPFNLLGIIILAGILFATSSSALSCFMTAPRTLQSLTKDKVLPKALNILRFDFTKRGTEPRFATLLTFFIGFSVIWIGNINVAAMIVGICYLLVYGWVNGSAFLERISGNPTFRPTSKSHWTISLYGFLACIFAILLFSFFTGVILLIIQLIIFNLILKYKSKRKIEGVWWGVMFKITQKALSLLNSVIQGSKNWRPIVTAIAFVDKNNNSPDKIAHLAEQIAAYKGLVSLNIIHSADNGEDIDDLNVKIPVSHLYAYEPTAFILSMVEVAHPGGIIPNTILLEFSKGINTTKIIKRMLELNKNILLLKNGEKLESHENIDIWWRGEKNGNLMFMIAYIIHHAGAHYTSENHKIRLIRKIDKDDNPDEIKVELEELLEKSRLSGEVIVIPHSDEPLKETLYEVSKESDLIMIGMPGNYETKEAKKLFSLQEFFFDKEIEKYDDFPPILFVKCANEISLIED